MIVPGGKVEHSVFGIGTVVAAFGSVVTVDFFGEQLDVDAEELFVRPDSNLVAPAGTHHEHTTDLSFRRSFEAVNLGVVPSDPDLLVNLTIGGKEISDNTRQFLKNSSKDGGCRVFMGYYGSGKSHHLRLVKAIAQREGWVTASLELDPKSADPAKPSSVYQELVTNLEFPTRPDGTKSEDFFDLVKEIRDSWLKIRSLKYFKQSPWFSRGIEVLQFHSHRRDDPEYVAGVSWLAGQVKLISAIRTLGVGARYRGVIPSLPQTKDTGLIYAFQLVVINEVLQALGYRGLAIIIDEAEHVRNYSINRYERASNFLDILARCAHRPRNDFPAPSSDYEEFNLPLFWREGPHFCLFAGLTDGDDTQELQREEGELSVLFHSANDVIRLQPPSPEDYGKWSDAYLDETSRRLGSKVSLLSDKNLRHRIATLLREQFEQTPQSEKMLRSWTKLAAYPAAVLMSQTASVGSDELVEIVEEAARQIAGEALPWDD